MLKKYDLSDKKVWVAGHKGLVGSAIVRCLEQRNNCEIIQHERNVVNLLDQKVVSNWMKIQKPDAIFIAAAKVGGIHANNTYPAEFIYNNLMIQTNIIHAAYECGVEKLLFLGSSCIYPKFAEQPMKETSLLTSSLEPTNEWYAIAKIAGIKMCQAYQKQYNCNFIAAMPTNLYGMNDNFDLNTSHVLPALLRKAHEAKINNEKKMMLWGSGKALREFLYVDDLADGLVFIMEHYSEEEWINIGSGEEISIRKLAKMIQDIVGFQGNLEFDDSMPDGTPRKLMDSSKLFNLGWKPKHTLREGIQKTYKWYLENKV